MAGRLFFPNPKVTADASGALELVPKQQLDAAIAALSSVYKTKTPTTVNLTDGSTVAINPAAGDTFKLSAAGNRTLLAPGEGNDAQVIVIRHLASGGARTLSLTTGSNGFAFGSDITALTATASGKTDLIQCMFDATAARWWVIGYVKGF